MRRKPRRLWLSILASAVMVTPTRATSFTQAICGPFGHPASCAGACPSRRLSLRLDLREPGQFLPLLDFLRDEIREGLGVAGKRRRMGGGEILLCRLHVADRGEP